MQDNPVFRVNTPHVICEAIDGEVILVHLETGNYYSLLKTATEVWRRIEQGFDRQALIQDMLQTYAGNPEDIATTIADFLAQLQREQLIAIDIANADPRPVSADPSQAQRPFENPTLEKFTDMEDLLLLDPIHEVSPEAGWPNPKAA